VIKTEKNFSLNKKEKSLRIMQDINGRKTYPKMGLKGRNTCFSDFSVNHKSRNFKVDLSQDFNQQVTPLVKNFGSPNGEYGMGSFLGSGPHKTYAKYNDKWNTIFEEMASSRLIKDHVKPGRRVSNISSRYSQTDQSGTQKAFSRSEIKKSFLVQSGLEQILTREQQSAVVKNLTSDQKNIVRALGKTLNNQDLDSAPSQAVKKRIMEARKSRSNFLAAAIDIYATEQSYFDPKAIRQRRNPMLEDEQSAQPKLGIDEVKSSKSELTLEDTNRSLGKGNSSGPLKTDVAIFFDEFHKPTVEIPGEKSERQGSQRTIFDKLQF
jgi:hypothetical protein